ncbi:phage antirepressor KilAC domain-containing protein [Enterobacter ludwigii]|uniref:phage antirepressor KilAC domain-containing protein n=1 Tax=Enterobacter ludwigii TaxID=299767 RepID=UPI001BAA7251|nr:phage antirepressor KilAC domain-containing protein [Enterobacter ludwigii]MBS0869858.1 phage antirepressor KilAC domain-containing protein [Enterobacter ludwigii]MCU3184661.1 phage antirepressor KilAC domain-containing protein [Enterobacter hormaechei subsp. steigerwaltii]MCU3375288.1 phage antirepressor KilAC domain-containing protein [Enterobacter hormaechei subsp. steigerwaltii]
MTQQSINRAPAVGSSPVFGAVVTMSSREIAALVQSKHGDVKRSAERLNAAGLLTAPLAQFDFEHNGNVYQEYRFNKRDSLVLVARLSPEFTAAVVDRWQELENKSAIPQTLPEALRLAADMAEQNAQLAHKVQQDAPKVAFVEHYVEAGGAKSLRETAKILNMPEKAMIDALLRDKVLFRQSGNLLPHALRQREGLFTVKTGTSDFGHAYTQTRVTPRGVEWIAQRYASELMGG